MSTFPFNDTDNFDLNLLLRLQHDIASGNLNDEQYENNILNTINNDIGQLEYTFDFNDNSRVKSRYFTQNQFITSSQSIGKNDLSLLHLNIRSANKNFEQLSLFLDNIKADCFVIGLTETWFSDEPHSMYSLSKHNLIFNNRINRRGGGVAMYVPTNLHYIVRNDLNTMSHTMESVFIEIISPKRKNLVVGTIYHPPSSDHNAFLLEIQQLLSNPSLQNKHCILMGDFNINLLKCDDDNFSQDFFDSLLSSSFIPLITRPTRLSSHSCTLIDNIFSNVDKETESGVILSDISDHCPIFAKIMSFFNPNSDSSPVKMVRKFTPENIERLKVKLNSLNWAEVLVVDDPNISFNKFMYILLNALNECIPLTKCKPDKKQKARNPWVTKSLLRSINRKNNLYYKYRANPTPKSREKYVNYKNTLTTLLRFEKRKFYCSQFELNKANIKETWKTINHVLNKDSNINNITQMKINNAITTDNSSIADSFNDYFSSIGRNLANRIPQTRRSFVHYLKNRNSDTLFLIPTDTEEILDIVEKSNNKKSSGYDDISNALLKQIINEIAIPLAHVFNLSIVNGIVPDKMKIAKVIPIHKKGDPLDISNYRPISLLSSISKLLEKIIHKRTIRFLKNFNIFSDSQFGFREKHSTTHAILYFIDHIASAIDDHLHTLGIFLDLSKAFDTIDHEILLYKLSHYGIRGKALEWFRSYLSNRKQFVSINGSNSDYKDITCGVPQGSLLGPLLFILYINDFQNSSNVLSFILFADDTSVFFSHKNPDTLLNTVNNELKLIHEWICCNKLSLNVQKTQSMLFSNSISTLPGNLSLLNTPIDLVQSTKFLGLFIDNKLSWKKHTTYLSKLISRNIGIINKLKLTFPSNILLDLYCTLILPYLNYGILAWGNSSRCQMDRLLLLQKRIMRIICNENWLAHTDQLFYSKKTLKIYDLYNLRLGCIMYQLNQNDLPRALSMLFSKNDSYHRYPTRQSSFYHLPMLRTIYKQKTLAFTGPAFWNSLDLSLKQSPSLFSLKRNLKLKLIKKYENTT